MLPPCNFFSLHVAFLYDGQNLWLHAIAYCLLEYEQNGNSPSYLVPTLHAPRQDELCMNPYTEQPNTIELQWPKPTHLNSMPPATNYICEPSSMQSSEIYNFYALLSRNLSISACIDCNNPILLHELPHNYFLFIWPNWEDSLMLQVHHLQMVPTTCALYLSWTELNFPNQPLPPK